MDQHKTPATKPHRLLLFLARILFLFLLPAIDVAISVRICNYRGSPRPDARLPNPDPQQPTIRSNPLGTYLPHPHSHFFPTHTTTYSPQPTRYLSRPALLRHTKQSTRHPLGTYLPCTSSAHTTTYPRLPTYLPPSPRRPQCTHNKSFPFWEKRRDPHKASNYYTVLPTYLPIYVPTYPDNFNNFIVE